VTVAEWVAERAGEVPAPLLAGVHEALGSAAGRPAHDAADALLDAAERRLVEFVPGGADVRGGALPLLTIDALITFALEAAADRPDEMDSRARRAMLRLAALGSACA
jgi:hypothetical protein